jgi:hypothetical protein
MRSRMPCNPKSKSKVERASETDMESRDMHEQRVLSRLLSSFCVRLCLWLNRVVYASCCVMPTHARGPASLARADQCKRRGYQAIWVGLRCSCTGQHSLLGCYMHRRAWPCAHGGSSRGRRVGRVATSSRFASRQRNGTARRRVPLHAPLPAVQPHKSAVQAQLELTHSLPRDPFLIQGPAA